MSRRTRWIAAGVVVVLVAAAATGVVAWQRLSSGSAVVAPRYVEETATAGHRPHLRRRLEYLTGGGVAVFDCDGDGRPDVYLAGGEHPGGAVSQREPGRRRAALLGGRGLGRGRRRA